MTRPTNARAAGTAFLVYIAAGVTPMAVATGRLIGIVLSLTECFCALVLAVTLYAITRDEDPDIALLALACRVVEGMLGATFLVWRLAGAPVGDAPRYNFMIAALFFAVGSTLFCWLLLRGRMIPLAMAWLGLIASVLLVVGLPLQLGGVVTGAPTQIMWLPMLAFEVPFGVWLIVKVPSRP